MRIRDREHFTIEANKEEMKLLPQVLDGLLAVIAAVTKNGRSRTLKRGHHAR
jgi:hypothetical protein